MGDGPWREERLLIDGTLVGAADGRTYENVNPATEEALGVAADAGPVDMDAAIGAARTAFDTTTWSTDHAFRVRCLRQLGEAMRSHAEELRATTVAEVGTPVALTYGPQLDIPVQGIDWVADLLDGYEWVEDLGRAEPYGFPSHRWVHREAAGVVAAITPWNYPNQINLAKVAPALAAGCTVVLKPAPDTPWTGLLLGRLVAEETDIPAGVFNVVTSSGNEVSAILSADPRVDLVSLTGSTATGRKVMAAAAATIKKVFLELGGKSAAIAMPDADMASAAGGVGMQCITHAGQGCATLTRLLVPRDRHDEAVDVLAAMMSSIAYGDPTDPSNLMGPLVNERQRQRVLGYIEKGRAEGGRVVVGGGVPSHLERGFYVEPTVFAGLDQDATLAQEEIFGPVAVVLAYDDLDDAVAIANNSIYGLSGAVYGEDLDAARAVAARIRTGTVGINGGLWYGPDVPFGGYKQSGIGREMGRLGFEEYLEVKAVAESV